MRKHELLAILKSSTRRRGCYTHELRFVDLCNMDNIAGMPRTTDGASTGWEDLALDLVELLSFVAQDFVSRHMLQDPSSML